VPPLLSRTSAGDLAVHVAGQSVSGALTGESLRRQLASRINGILKSQPDGVKDQMIDEIAAQCLVSLPQPPGDCGSCTWEQLREMESAGVEIGSHTVTHPVLTRVTTDRLRRELEQSRGRLEGMLARPVTMFCYPNGAYDRTVRDAGASGVRVGGYERRWLEQHLDRSAGDPRIHNEEQDLTHFQQSTSGFEEAKNQLRRAGYTTSSPVRIR
jgi:peptidoglycan/xylan/chitin deacetylase (PgdA/CDA1 family)